jgi:hypothetical protein
MFWEVKLINYLKSFLLGVVGIIQLSIADDIVVHLENGQRVFYPSDKVERITFSVEDKREFNEAEVRSKIVDAQLGGVIGYYRRFDDPNSVEAVRRWDAGVRVVNLDKFERKIIQGRGWLVVYRGTDLRAHCGEAVLTTDPDANPHSAHSISRFEKEVRSKIADAQLGGVIGFYRRFKDPESVEAVRRWDAGIRIENIDRFERKVVPGKGWQVVYKGTLEKADYGDFKLTATREIDARTRYLQRKECIHNLRQISGAQDQVLLNDPARGLTRHGVNEYLEKPDPVCPACGKRYDLTIDPPVCPARKEYPDHRF